MNIAEKVIDIVKGMEGIGGVPTDEEFLNEFEFRLQALKKGQTLPIDSVSEQRELLEAFVKQLKEDNELTEEITFQDINKCIASNCG